MTKWIAFKFVDDFIYPKTIKQIAKQIAQARVVFIRDYKTRKYLRTQTRTKIFEIFFPIQYKYIISAGEACFVAQALGNIDVRKFSGPMDWMYGSDLVTRLNLIANEYRNYFEKGDLKYHVFSGLNCCDVYLNRKTGLYYNHDFSGHGNFNDEYPVIYEKYQRRISRVVNMLKSGSKILIIYAEWMPSRDSARKPNLSEVRKAIQQINAAYSNNVDVLYLAHNDEMKPGAAKIMPRNSNLIYGEYFGYENSQPVSEKAKKSLIILSKVIDFVARKKW